VRNNRAFSIPFWQAARLSHRKGFHVRDASIDAARPPELVMPGNRSWRTASQGAEKTFGDGRSFLAATGFRAVLILRRRRAWIRPVVCRMTCLFQHWSSALSGTF